MKIVELTELKDSLSAHLKLVEAGEEILILDGDRAVARILKVESSGNGDERMQKLIAAGIIVAPELRDGENRRIPKPAGDPPIPQEIVDRLWEEERDNR